MEWKINERFPRYKVSDRGDVISLHTNEYMTPKYTNSHRRYQLRDANKNIRVIKADELVCETFNGPCPKGYIVSHINGNDCDYSADNLEWVKNKPKLTIVEKYKYSRVKCVETGEIFDSIYTCSEITGIKLNTLKKCLYSNYIMTRDGLHFEFIE